MASSTFRLVPAVDKAARLLAELSAPEPLGVSELARRIGASKGTVRDILMTLTMHGLVERDEDARFRMPQRDLVSLALPRIAALMNETGQTTILGLVRDGRLEIAARSEPSSDLHVTAPLGRRLPLDVGAHAKVLSGEQPIGYDDEEYLAGVRATAAPIVDGQGRAIGAVLVVGFKEKLDLRTLRRIGERCAQIAAELSRSLATHAARPRGGTG